MAPRSSSQLFPEVAVSVAGVTQYVQDLLEGDEQLHQIWVIGEVSSAKAHSKGVFFTLQDPQEAASINCVTWKSQQTKLVTLPEPGELVVVLGQMKVYPSRGQYQLTVWQCLPAGDGLAALRYRQLRERLLAEGLFDPARKCLPPAHPQVVAVVTSAQAAAWGDIQRTLQSRYPGLQVLLSPATVQGEQAPVSIVRAIARVIQDTRADVIILARGGGATEDLACFNDERVVRAISDCPIPVITGIGHERDQSLADLAADVAAHTPTAAAAIAVPNLEELQLELAGGLMRLRQAIASQLLDQQELLQSIRRRLQVYGVGKRLNRELQQQVWLQQRLLQSIQNRLLHEQNHQKFLAQTLESLDPKAVLRRGYALVQRENGKVVRRGRSLALGDEVRIQLSEGKLKAVITEIE
ncbi:MAG: exodeoxyribonuclease VII large subunit [Synechococcales cyanobacterium CRU_2_2]|nr:exodeoxyribonuclease VII large subunit [Synechococcales cyanobacterium CRU_2_2]